MHEKKCVLEFSDQFQHKLGCTITEYGQKLEIDSRIEGLLKLCTDKQTNTVIRYAFTLHLIFFFISVLRPFQYYFTYIKMSQSVGCAKLGELWGKPPDTPTSRIWLLPLVTYVGLKHTPATTVDTDLPPYVLHVCEK